ncbi:MAG: SDR family oxidoreductase [Acidimicrobiales bacterium]|nr:SDR family oxidoreductase [Acidimicrobiales bacterium]
MGRLDGKVAHVTGAASGIGEACVQRFAAEGAIVYGTDIAEPTDFAGHDFSSLDVTDEAAQMAQGARIAEKQGRVDIVVTAAGIAAGGPIHTLSVADWQRCQDINLTGTMVSIKAVLPAMLAQRSGSIITVASVEGLEGCEGGSTYNASKGGVVLLTKNVACDYGPSGIRANAICPGFIDTPMLRDTLVDGSDFKNAIIGQHKLRRFGESHEIASAALFLGSDDASFVTGVALPVDGGYNAGHAYGLGEAFGQM